MGGILTVTLNPALDMAAHVPRLEPRGKLRCSNVRMHPGGGGVNVSRTIKRLGGSSRAVVVVGGALGKAYLGLLEAEGIAVTPHWISGETRQSFSVTEDAHGKQYRFVLPGPTWTAEEAHAITTQIIATVDGIGYAVLSGSLPPGSGDDVYIRLSERLAAYGVRVVVDASGPALEKLVTTRNESVYLLRMNRKEANGIAGDRIDTQDDALRFADMLVSRGVTRVAVLTLGDEGAVLATAAERVRVTGPAVEVVSAIGGGDSFVGALVLALSAGQDIGEACRDGVAAAAATMTTPATELCDRDMVERLRPKCKIVRAGRAS